MSDSLRIANCSGFYGDRISAAREMVEGGPIDVLTGDYLAELTLMILLKDKLKKGELGYAKTFLRQLQEVAEAFEHAHELGMFTVLWTYIRNPEFAAWNELVT